MENNNLLMIIFAFVVGFMLPGMMNNMCGVRLIEGNRGVVIDRTKSTANHGITIPDGVIAGW